jgi:hypothetical protein
MIKPGQVIGNWTVLTVDPSSRRSICRCRCGAQRAVTLTALEAGESTSCGCAPLPKAEIARRLPDWRPKR